MDERRATLIGSVLKVIACTPNEEEDLEVYRRGVLEPSQAIRKIGAALGENTPSREQAAEVLRLLVTVLETKKIARAEQLERLEEVVTRVGLDPRLVEELSGAAQPSPAAGLRP